MTTTQPTTTQPTTTQQPTTRPPTSPAVGTGHTRIEAIEKVTGRARYAGEYPLPELAYGWIVQSTIARGRVTSIDVDAALAMPGVLAVLHHGNATKLTSAGDPTALLLQDDLVPHYGSVVALVVAATSDQARAAAETLPVGYHQEPHDVTFTPGHPSTYTPDHVNPNQVTDTESGDDLDAAYDAAPVRLDLTYSTPAEQNNPMEPHAATAYWHADRVTVFDSNQGVYRSQQSLATLFGLEASAVTVRSDHVGGGFGSKGSLRPSAVLAVMAAKLLDRPVRVVLTRRQMFALVGYRTPTTQRVRIAADRAGRLRALEHTAWSQTSTVDEFAEQTATMTRMMYDSAALVTRHRLVALDVPTPRWMRAPGETPGSFALESALDELAIACGVDPVELRVRNEPAAEPGTGRPFGSRDLIGCLREGARRFGWAGRDPRPGTRRDGRWLLGTGVGAATYPARNMFSTATVTAEPDGGYTVRIAANDIGTGARTALTQIAADELAAPMAGVRVLIGDSAFGPAMLAGGSMGTASWSWAIVKACRLLRARLETGEPIPADGLTVAADTTQDVAALPDQVRHSYGAQFAEVAVDPGTGEVRVRRLLGVFAAGRIVNPITARSQLIGGMVMGISMALHEEAIMDVATGDYLNHDLANYHVAAHADIGDLEAIWLPERNPDSNPSEVKGIGEVSIVGVAAAIANAVWHATGVRHRDLPIRPDRVLTATPESTHRTG